MISDFLSDRHIRGSANTSAGFRNRKPSERESQMEFQRKSETESLTESQKCFKLCLVNFWICLDAAARFLMLFLIPGSEIVGNGQRLVVGCWRTWRMDPSGRRSEQSLGLHGHGCGVGRRAGDAGARCEASQASCLHRQTSSNL